MQRIVQLFITITLLSSLNAIAKVKEYNLDINYKYVNYTGHKVVAMAINNTIPGTVLEFTEGDEAIINVTNSLKTDASVHWHGLLLPQDQDGVPYLTSLPIKPRTTFQYKFPLTHAGTYWYHSHSRIDEQRGQFGAIIVHPKNGYDDKFDFDSVVQLSDWSNEAPYNILKNLKKDGEWYAHKKNSKATIAGYVKSNTLNIWLENRYNRMGAMDVSDVAYDAFLANGKQHLDLFPNAKAGDVVRLRFINSGASTYFNIEQVDSPMTVIAADGVDIQPVIVNKINIAMAETYDVLVTIPTSGALQLSANSVDGTGGSTITVGNGRFNEAPKAIKPNIYNPHSAHHDKSATITKKESRAHSMHHGHHNMVMSDDAGIKTHELLNYSLLKARIPTTNTGNVQKVTLRLTGNMDSYNWNFNNTPLSKADKIKIKKGGVVQFIFKNETMMNHPLHLHGHFFKVISGNGAYDAIKHTVNVSAMSETVIEFTGEAEKDWLFHCHQLYHAKSGMARVIRYDDYDGNKNFTKAKMSSDMIMDDDWYDRVDISLLSNKSAFSYRYSNTDNIVTGEFENFYTHGKEVSLTYERRLGRWLNAYSSIEYEEHQRKAYAQIGIKYTLPFQVDSAIWLNSDGEVHAGFSTEFQLIRDLSLEISGDTEKEWSWALEYQTTNYTYLTIQSNNKSGAGLGLRIVF